MKRFTVFPAIFLIISGLVLMSSHSAQAQSLPRPPVEVQFPMWDWVISVDPIDPATGQPAGAPVDVPVWGEATFVFDDNNVPGGLGTPEDPKPLPPGEQATIPIEMVALQLSSAAPVEFPGLSEPVMVRVTLRDDNHLGFNTPDQNRGLIRVENQGGFLVGDSFFDVFFEIEIDDDNGNQPNNMVLATVPPVRLGMTFTADNSRIPAADVFWVPGWVWLENVPGGNLPPSLLFEAGIPNPWDVVVDLHGFFTPECVETVNPHGKKVPPAGSTTLPGPKGGRNDDGFYQLLVGSPAPGPIKLFVTDANGSGPFGPFNSGDNLKITEAPGATASIKKMGSSKGQAGAIAAHVTLTGDAIVNAVDPFGNVTTTTCFVPPPPK